VGAGSRRAAPEAAFVEFVLEQLSTVPGVAARRMFGAHGVFRDGVMFGIVAGQTLYLKTDEASRPGYLERGLAPFTFVTRGRSVQTRYFAVPPEFYEDSDQRRVWLDRAQRAALA
jgi:DNA transformation protein and related proteins